jgi:UDP-sugar pyrophosphorylase
MVNPFEGWAPAVPKGVSLEPLSDEFFELESIGRAQLGHCGFVLVAGGLGERLGFSGIKLSLPTENILGRSYIQLYCEYILSAQARHAEHGILIPLAIMVSDDTEVPTRKMFLDNANFGLCDAQISMVKQEAVAALSDNDAHLAASETSPYRLSLKPHGHGDVHALMHSSGTAEKWAREGIHWCYFFQDTNALAFMSLPIMLGVSIRNGCDINSMTVPRKAKQAVGGIVRLESQAGGAGPARSMTINVEYNQLDPLLRANGSPDGDTDDPATGMSPFPGNVNELLFHLPPYLRVLQSTHGVIGEFVNPKYADAAREVFKKPTRLECMMQDFPKALEVDQERVAFTQAPNWFCYSPVKNAQAAAIAFAAAGIPPACPMSGESDLYGVTARILRLLGCSVEEEDAPPCISGITAPLGPRILCAPSCALTVTDMKEVFAAPGAVKISVRSTLILKGCILIDSLNLDGSLIIDNKDPHVKLIVRTGNEKITNLGHEIVVSDGGEDSGEREKEIRKMFGYDIVAREVQTVTLEAGAWPPGICVFNGVEVVSA